MRAAVEQMVDGVAVSVLRLREERAIASIYAKGPNSFEAGLLFDLEGVLVRPIDKMPDRLIYRILEFW